MPARSPAPDALARAFDEAEFGPANTLDLHALLPSAAQAEARAEAWLRERQVAQAERVLVITGRGAHSEAGAAVLRPAIERLLARLTRAGVVRGYRRHTAGAFVVVLAPFAALFAAAPRRKDPRPRATDPAGVAALGPEARALLRALALRSLELLGTPTRDDFVADEMLRQFSRLAPAVAGAADPERALVAALRAAQTELDDAG
jgi:hypothetical protein